jgi:single-strand DNA-binding protein
MSNDLNYCSFIGRLGADPETRYSPNGDAVASFRIAVGSTWRDKSSGEKRESTEWVSITAFGKLGEIVGEYCKKGGQVFVSGRMKTDKYTDKEGVERYSTKIIADKMQLLGGKRDGDSAPHETGSERHERKAVVKPAAQGASGAFDDFADDIPF